eukprot:jgi/Antlo1/169/777
MESCVFCRVYKTRQGILYEDENTFLIADIAPLSSGHLLLVAKGHFEFLHEAPDSVLSSIILNTKKVAKGMGYKRYNLLQNNGHMQSVPHFHLHIIPASEDSSLLVNWKTMNVSEQELECFRARVRQALC